MLLSSMDSSFSGSLVEAPSFEYPSIPEFTLGEKLKQEKESTGMYFSGHLIDSYSREIESLKSTPIIDLMNTDDFDDKQTVTVSGIVGSVSVKTTRKNEEMAFITLEDRYGEIECLIFPRQYTTSAYKLRVDSALAITGHISIRDDEAPKILASDIYELTENSRYIPKENVVGTSKKEKTVTEHKASEKKPIADISSVKKIYLRVPDLNSAQYLKAKNIVDIFEGDISVIFYNEKEKKYLNYDRRITLSRYILKELQDILGADNVALR